MFCSPRARISSGRSSIRCCCSCVSRFCTYGSVTISATLRPCACSRRRYAATTSSAELRAKRNENGFRKKLPTLSTVRLYSRACAGFGRPRQVRGAGAPRSRRRRQRRTRRHLDRAQAGCGVGGRTRAEPRASQRHRPAPRGLHLRGVRARRCARGCELRARGRPHGRRAGWPRRVPTPLHAPRAAEAARSLVLRAIDTFWLGGMAGAGKTTAARALARPDDLRLYSLDARSYEHEAKLQAVSRTLDELWVESTPEALADWFEEHARRRFRLVLADLSAIGDEAPVIVDGPQLLPELVAPTATSLKHVLYLVATPELQRQLVRSR